MYNIDSIFTWIVTRPCAQWQQIGKSKVLGNKNTKGIAYTYVRNSVWIETTVQKIAKCCVYGKKNNYNSTCVSNSKIQNTTLKINSLKNEKKRRHNKKTKKQKQNTKQKSMKFYNII